MIRQRTSERAALFGYFLTLTAVGTLLLYLPAAWNGTMRLGLLDALFTSVSAVCVTGLITVDTALYSPFGKGVILFLIQFGGLGILTFTTMFFVSVRDRKVSLRDMKMVKKYYLESIEFQAHHILRNILVLTFSVEAAGAFLLWLRFRQTVPEGSAFFTAIFHSISAFCNAGFSLFSDSLAGYAADPYILIIIMLLIIIGGLGFLIFNDAVNVLFKKKKRFSLHTTIVLTTTLALVSIGAVAFYLMEYRNTLAEMGTGRKIVNSLFQSITPRTAGFNTLDQNELTGSSKFLTMILMVIGGSPASIAGGIKTTTFAIILMAMLKEIDWHGRIRFRDRALSQKTVTRSILFMTKAVALLVLSTFFLTLTEMNGTDGETGRFMHIAFESFSAFGTVGLSTGLTSELSAAGKGIIILTMFAGRVGLISLSIPLFRDDHEEVEFPEEEVLIG